MMYCKQRAKINHTGAINNGHYTVIIKCEDGRWRDFNDYNISPISESKVVTKLAYSLVYRIQVSCESQVVENIIDVHAYTDTRDDTKDSQVIGPWKKHTVRVLGMLKKKNAISQSRQGI